MTPIGWIADRLDQDQAGHTPPVRSAALPFGRSFCLHHIAEFPDHPPSPICAIDRGSWVIDNWHFQLHCILPLQTGIAIGIAGIGIELELRASSLSTGGCMILAVASFDVVLVAICHYHYRDQPRDPPGRYARALVV